MWGLIIQVAVWAGLYIANRLMRPKPTKSKPLTKDNLTLPRTEEGSPIPIVFGTCRVDSAILVWTSDLYTRVCDNANNGAQYCIYSLDMIFNVGIPMGNGVTTGNSLIGPKYRGMWIGDKRVGVATLPSAIGANFNHYKMVYQPYLLGGPGSGGGLVGVVGFMGGWTDQNLSSPPTRIGGRLAAYLGTGNYPGYRKQMLVCLTGGINDTNYNLSTIPDGNGGTSPAFAIPAWGFELGEAANVDSMAFEISARGDAIYAGGWTPAFSQMSKFGQDADPIEVIFDVLTNKWGRAGADTAKVDTASFQAASTTLQSENHGYSRVVYGGNENAAKVVTEVLHQIDAAFYEEPTTGLWTIKLIRGDYDPLTIQLFDVDNIVSVDDYSIGAWKDTINEVRVTYTDRSAGYKPGVAIAQSLANAFGNSNRRRPAAVEYPGCTSAELAGKLAARDLNVLSQPLSKLRLTVNRDGHRLRPGSVFRITWSEYNLNNAVFRCQRVDQGQLFDNKVHIDAVQDAFSTTYVGIAAPWDIVESRTPYPFINPIITESPRWLQAKGYTSGLIVDPDMSHLMPLLYPTTNSTQYMLQTRIALASKHGNQIDYEWLIGIPQRAFPTTFTIRTAVPRENEPFDTTIGIQIENVVLSSTVTAEDPNPFDAIYSQPIIEGTGKNLLCFVTPAGDQEFVAFESATLDGGGLFYTLNRVYRGLLDTPAIALPVGTRGWFVEPSMISRSGWDINSTAEVLAVPRALLVVGSGWDLTNSVAIKGRGVLPYPVADLGVNSVMIAGSKGMPAAAHKYKNVSFAEEALDIFFTLRDRLSPFISRGDDAGELTNDFSPPLADVSAVFVNGSNRLYFPGGISLSTTPAGGDGGALVDGYGQLDIEQPSARTLVAGDPFIGIGGLHYLSTLNNWRNAKVPVYLPSWRNLLGNCKFNYQGGGGFDMWNMLEASGAALMQSGATSLQLAASGPGSYYAEGNATPVIRAQGVSISNWKPRGYTAVMTGYARNTQVDANDTVNLTVRAFDISSAFISESALGAIACATANWTRKTISHTLPASTYSVRAKWTLAEVAGGGTGNANVAFTDTTLRVGQFKDAVLANPSFEIGPLTNWTIGVGGWNSAAGSASPTCIYGAAFATSTLYQEYTLPAGWEVGSDAFVECYRMQTLANDAGEVKVEVMDGASAVLSSATTGLENITTLSQWFKRVIFCSIPDGATKVRVTLTATRSLGAGNSSAYFDEIGLWISKKLQPAYVKQLSFSALSVQPMPTYWQEYVRKYPAITYPRWIFSGQDSNIDGIEWTDGAGHTDGTLVGPFGGGVTSVFAYNFLRATGASALHLAATGPARTQMASFSSAQSFSALCYFRVDESPFSVACGIVGRMDLSNGWGIELTAGGAIQVRMRGSSGFKTATTGRNVADRAFHMGALVYDAIAQTLTAYDEQGASASTSTAAGLGEIFEESTTNHLRIGRCSDDFAVLPGQIARVYVWDKALTTAEIAAHWNYAKDPTGLITTYTRTATAVAAVAPNADGAQLAYHSATQVAIPYHANLIADGGSGFGLAVGRSSSNMIPSWDLTDAAKWAPDATVTLTQAIVDPTGLPRGVNVSGDSTHGITALLVTAGGAAITLTTSFWMRLSIGVGSSLDIVLRSSAGVEISRQTITLTTTWQRFDNTWAWSGATATCRFQLLGTNLSFDLGHVAYCGNPADGVSAARPQLIPLPASTHGDYNAEVSTTLPVQFNREGEIIAEGTSSINGGLDSDGTIIDVKNGVNDKNRRKLSIITGSTIVRHAHYDGAAAVNNSDSAYTHFDRVWKARGRWNSIGLVDVTAGRFAQSAISDNITPTPIAEGGAGRVAIWAHDTTQSTKIQIGTGTSSPEDVILRTVTVQAREEKFD